MSQVSIGHWMVTPFVSRWFFSKLLLFCYKSLTPPCWVGRKHKTRWTTKLSRLLTHEQTTNTFTHKPPTHSPILLPTNSPNHELTHKLTHDDTHKFTQELALKLFTKITASIDPHIHQWTYPYELTHTELIHTPTKSKNSSIHPRSHPCTRKFISTPIKYKKLDLLTG